MLVRDAIAQERKRQGISVAQLAEMVGTTKATISRYETGAIKTISKDTLKKISEALQYDFNDLVCNDPKYCSYTSSTVDYSTLSDDDQSLLKWFHNLPKEFQRIIKELWSISLPE